MAAKSATSVAEVLQQQGGMAPFQVDRLLKELERVAAPESKTPAFIAERVALLQMALGEDTPMAEALFNGGIEMLNQDINAFPAQLVKLKAALGGAEVGTLVAREPRLLWMASVDIVVPKVLAKLLAIYPYKSRDKKGEVLKLVQEYPELLVRMSYYCDNPTIKAVEDLPVDLQNRIKKSYC